MRAFVFFLFCTFLVFGAQATGPSYIRSEMNPVAVNDRGDVLCYTRFERNPSGGHAPMLVVYGYAVLTADTIRHYTLHVLDWDPDVSDEVYYTGREFWDSIYYNGSFRERYLTPEIQTEFGFTAEGLGAFRVDRTISVPEFKSLKNIDLYQFRQQSLFGGRSRNNYVSYGNRVHILYDFGHIVVLQNRFEEYPEFDGGCAFNYTHPWGDERLDYEYYNITGVLFIPKK